MCKVDIDKNKTTTWDQNMDNGSYIIIWKTEHVQQIPVCLKV